MAHAALRVGFAGRERRRSQTAAAAFGFDYVFGRSCLVQRTGFKLVKQFSECVVLKTANDFAWENRIV